MADRARNQHGLGKAVTFNVITPMTRLGTWVVALALWFFDFWKPSQNTAKQAGVSAVRSLGHSQP
jgi:hypothetical protein